MKKSHETLKALGLLNQIAITMMVPIIGCVFFGIFLDKKLGTTPWLLIIFMFIGIGVAFRNLFVITKSFAKTDKKKRP
ncbi:MAG: AtpZ/AtpI family protein [Vallitaleaceae bacterium]|jgi:ATP synthase protein I|nr:AtpZ/AtpI family protein [Vallitaleaceae bacterium]